MTRLFGARPSGFLAHLVGGPSTGFVLPLTAQPTSLRDLCTYVDNQIGDECVGEMLAGCHSIVTGGQGKRLSAHGIYTAARVRERARKTDPVEDIGCDPADALNALVDPGAYPRDANDFDPSKVNATETWAEALSTQRFQPSDLQPIGTGDTDTVDLYLTGRFPVGNWMPVDQSFLDFTGKGVWRGMTGPAKGGHATVIVALLPSGDYLIWNSYGPDWGDGGFAIVAREVIQQRAGLCAMVGGPVLG